MKRIFALLLLFTCTASAADCTNIMPGGEPAIKDSIRLCRAEQSYLTVYNPACKVAHFSAQVITRENLNGPHERRNNFKEDPAIPEHQRSTLSDYRKTGFDRGHLAPAADFTYSEAAMSDSFLMSNMIPQHHNANAGVWAEAEDRAREWAQQEGKVFVVSGPIFKHTPIQRIGEGVCVPSHTFKIIRTEDRVLGSYVVPNTNQASKKPLLEYERSVDFIETVVGIDLIHD